MNIHENIINWFEIPVIDMNRARHFYQVIFGIHLNTESLPAIDMAYFPSNPGNGKVSGALAKSEFHTPSGQGVKVYLNGNPDLSTILDKVESEGGKVLMPKTLINEQVGYMAFFSDSEGNTVALHSQG